MKVFLNKAPRSIALVSDDYALILRDITTLSTETDTFGNRHHHHHLHHHNEGEYKDKDFQPRCIIEFVPASILNLDAYKEITSPSSLCFGFLGLMFNKGYIFLGLITNQREVGSVRPSEIVNKITGVEFLCLTSDEYDVTSGFSNDILLLSKLPDDKQHIHPCHSMRKILSGGGFYYSGQFDITASLQIRGIEQNGFQLLYNDTDGKFMWNSYMNQELIEFRSRLLPNECKIFDKGGFLTTIIRGFVKTVNTFVGDEEALLTIIAKQSSKRSGKLFGPWGIDDEGYVANFMELESILYTGKYCFSYTQIRGNVPVFWQLQNLITSTKIEFTRSSEATMLAFKRHFEKLILQYRDIHIVKLLNKKGNQSDLNAQYSKILLKSKLLETHQVSFNDFDFSTDSLKHDFSAISKAIYMLEDEILNYGSFCYDVTKNEEVGRQLGVFLVNSFDSLDKATAIQRIINKEALQLSLRAVGIEGEANDLWAKHDYVWNEAGSFLTKLTTSSISTKSNQINKSGGFIGAMAGISKKYITPSEFAQTKEHALNKLLGRLETQKEVKLHDPIHDFISTELQKNLPLYSSQRDISIFCGTFNINGVLYQDDISPWLFPEDSQFKSPPDIVAIGFEEIVELTAGKMLETDKTNRLFWEKKLRKLLNTKDSYNLIWAGQLGGIALFLFSKSCETDYISNVEGSIRKTGLGGYASNKGAVLLSFLYASTKFCIVVSHLAAGLNNVDERHQDYKTIAKNIRFRKNKTIKDHDIIIWMGDFNFRIALPNEVVRDLVSRKEYSTLFDNDQLNNQMAAGESFPYFDEMEITFAPTYKFDNGTTTYDTSEKQRVPAWTDRILSLDRKNILRQVSYNSCPSIIFSDHRPVYGEFFAKVTIEDEKKRHQLALELYDQRKMEIGDVNELITSQYINELVLTHGLPPPSSDKNKWWINGQPVKVSFPDWKPGMVPNPEIPLNPFDEESKSTTETEFIKVQ